MLKEIKEIIGSVKSGTRGLHTYSCICILRFLCSQTSEYSDPFLLLCTDVVKCLTFSIMSTSLIFFLLYHLEIPKHNLIDMNIYEDHCLFIILMRMITSLYHWVWCWTLYSVEYSEECSSLEKIILMLVNTHLLLF